jgi:hypothetical protein
MTTRRPYQGFESFRVNHDALMIAEGYYSRGNVTVHGVAPVFMLIVPGQMDERKVGRGRR